MLPKPPEIEPPRDDSLVRLAPKMRLAVEAVLKGMDDAGQHCFVFEAYRSPIRQEYLYGFGREYDDGRGIVTRASTTLGSWHGYGLAVDIVQDDSTPWIAPQKFWRTLGLLGEKHGLTWGGRWKAVDLPHLQWGKCPISPRAEHRQMLIHSTYEAIWDKFGAR